MAVNAAKKRFVLISSMTSPMVRVRLVVRLCAIRLGRYPRDRIASSIRALVSEAIASVRPLSRLDTVLTETPLADATSRIVTCPDRLRLSAGMPPRRSSTGGVPVHLR